MTSKKSYKHDKERNDIILNCLDKYNVIPDIVQIIVDMLTINLFEIGVCKVISKEERLCIPCKTNIKFTIFNNDIWNEYKLFQSYMQKYDYWIRPWVLEDSIDFTIMYEKTDSKNNNNNNVVNNVIDNVIDNVVNNNNNSDSYTRALPLNLMKLYYNEHRSQ